MKTDLSELAQFDAGDLALIESWLQQSSYRQTAERIHEVFQRTVHVATLQRLAARSAPKDFLDDSPAARDAAAQILKYAASGQPQFTPAAIAVLEQTAFQLSLTSAQRPEDLETLTQIFNILFRHRGMVVREQHARLQERKLELRRLELETRSRAPRKPPTQKEDRNLPLSLSAPETASTPPIDPSPIPIPSATVPPNEEKIQRVASPLVGQRLSPSSPVPVTPSRTKSVPREVPPSP